MKMVIQKAVFEGFGDFPVDMLRYDRCHPATERDSALAGGTVTLSRCLTKRQVTVSRLAEKGRKWTIDRWKSFGWQLLSEENRAY